MDWTGTVSTLDLGQSQGQDVIPPLNDDLTNLFNCIDLVKDEILKYLDGSALINLSSVNMGIRQVVISSQQYKKKVNLKVNTKSLDIFLKTLEPLPPWTANLAHMTLDFNSNMVFISREKFLSLAPILPNLTSLEVINQSQLYTLDKILDLSSKLKSLSLPYNFMLNPFTFNHAQNYEEVKITTSNYKIKFNQNFEQNLDILATKCVKLKSFSCQEISKVGGRYVNLDDEDEEEDDDDDDEEEDEDHNFFNGIMTIIEKNSQSLVKLEIGISQLVVENLNFSSNLAKISLPNLKFLDLRMKSVNPELVVERLDILKNLQPEQLTTLKLTFTAFPIELFALIPQKFQQLISLSLKASKYNSHEEITEDRWSFLQSLIHLEELEITRFKIDYGDSDFGEEISENFPAQLVQNNNLRKLILKGMRCLGGTTFLNDGIAKMINLKELSLTGCHIYLDNLLPICSNLKDLEKLEISNLHPDKLNPHTGVEIDYHEILTSISSLKCLKELSVEMWYYTSSNFGQMLGTISFPYLNKLILCNANLEKEELKNLIGSNGLLKEISIIRSKLGHYEDPPQEDSEIANERKNLKIDYISKQGEINPHGSERVHEDLDPDSRPLSEQNIFWPPWPTAFESQNSDTDVDI